MPMNEMFQETWEIPDRARELIRSIVPLELPRAVPYLGMGSSYFAPLAFKFMGVDIYPEMASEYFCYAARDRVRPQGVILSQSGRSSEAVWCARLFERFIAVTNVLESPLARSPNVSAVIPLMAGPERFSSSKTYINTLLVLFRGLGFNPEGAVARLAEQMPTYADQGRRMADEVCRILGGRSVPGIFILGNGPNIATALEAALVCSESSKRVFIGMPLAQYDHGPKETAKDSIVIVIVAKGRTRERSLRLAETVERAGAHVLLVESGEAEEHESAILNIVPFNFMACHLAQKLEIPTTFLVGGKVTEVGLDPSGTRL
jgi:glucosamine--fructose-6-phosphate aminotransferase (isomerizing)